MSFLFSTPFLRIDKGVTLKVLVVDRDPFRVPMYAFIFMLCFPCVPRPTTLTGIAAIRVVDVLHNCAGGCFHIQSWWWIFEPRWWWDTNVFILLWPCKFQHSVKIFRWNGSIKTFCQDNPVLWNVELHSTYKSQKKQQVYETLSGISNKSFCSTTIPEDISCLKTDNLKTGNLQGLPIKCHTLPFRV